MDNDLLDNLLIEKEFNYQDDLFHIERLYAMSLDHFFCCMILIPPFALALVMLGELFMNFVINEYSMTIILALYLNKDSVKGKSIGKRILGQVIIDRTTKKPANPIRCLIRNSTISFWPLEVLVTLFSPKRRIGDLIANTMVVRIEKKDIQKISEEYKKTDKSQIGIALFLSIIITFVVMNLLGYLFSFLIQL